MPSRNLSSGDHLPLSFWETSGMIHDDDGELWDVFHSALEGTNLAFHGFGAPSNTHITVASS